MSICALCSRQEIDCITKIHQNLLPRVFNITLGDSLRTWMQAHWHISVHRSQLIIIESTQELSLTHQ
ncbi:Uncharacterised protein [Segatella copri]|nr:Uncharacterised protein [Segatella copri]